MTPAAPPHSSAQLVIGRGHDKGVDYWALGILLYEQVAGYSPFADHEHHDQMAICKSILRGEFEFPAWVKDKEARDGLGLGSRAGPSAGRGVAANVT